MLLAPYAYADPIADREREAATLEQRGDFPARAVRAHLDVALAMVPQASTTRADVRAAHANVRRILADRAFERAATAPLPKLNFKRPGASKRSSERFHKWIDLRVKGGAAVTKLYEEVLAMNEPHASLASMLRLGQQSRVLASELTTALRERVARPGVSR